MQTENERLSLLENSPKLDQEPLDRETLHHRKWRGDVQKSKWMSQTPFIPSKGHKQVPWEQLQNTREKQYEPYREPTRHIERSREQQSEVSNTSFSSTVPKDPWQYKMSRSNSIRGYKAILGAVRSISPTMSSLDKASAKTTMERQYSYKPKDFKLQNKNID